MITIGLSLKYGRYVAIASASLLAAKNIVVPLVTDKEIDNLCIFTRKTVIFTRKTSETLE